jgi:dephospho-CoA kinase
MANSRSPANPAAPANSPPAMEPSPTQRPLRIGLTGGIAAGKSAIANILTEWGAERIDADAIAHEVLTRPEVIAELASLFGPELLTADGQISRQQLARRVFGNQPEQVARRRQLETIVHPRVRSESWRRITAAPPSLVAIVLDVPLLLETEWAAQCDRILFIDTPAEQRQARALSRGWSPDELAAREAAQMPVQEKRRRATDVLDNSGSLEQSRAQLSQLWQNWLGIPPPGSVPEPDRACPETDALQSPTTPGAS